MKKEILKDNLKTAISQLGGIKAVAERFEIPYRTVQNWSDGVRTPPIYVAKMIIEAERQKRRIKELKAEKEVILDHCKTMKKKNDESYKDYVEEQEALSWYETELKKERERVKELTERNFSLANQLGKMNDLAIENREEIESCYSNINELADALKALKKELAKYKKACEYWSDRANRNSSW